MGSFSGHGVLSWDPDEKVYKTSWVDSMTRLASLTEEARNAMLLQFFRFLARVELDPRVFDEL